jgi:hypothetical protein
MLASILCKAPNSAAVRGMCANLSRSTEKMGAIGPLGPRRGAKRSAPIDSSIVPRLALAHENGACPNGTGPADAQNLPTRHRRQPTDEGLTLSGEPATQTL